ncbi:MAG: hypothetical protein IJJ64_07590 [Butyrivibrio sp.]|nr:hypothetical protein [Butyrivibrio sp.]
MKEKLKNILDTFHKYNSEHMVMQAFAMEYAHLDEIKSFDTDLIEMETSSFYLMASGYA